MNGTGSICAHGRKEVLSLEVVCNLFQLLAVTREKYATSARTVANTDYISLYILRAVRCSVEGLVVPAMSTRQIGERCFVEALQKSALIKTMREMVPTWKSKQGIWFGCQPDTHHTRRRFVVYLGFPVVDLILFRYG